MPGEFRYVSDREVAMRHSSAKVPTKSPARGVRPEIARTPEIRNIETVLSLGDTRYFRFRRWTIGVLPLPFKKGQALLDLYLKTMAMGKIVAEKGDKDVQSQYYRNLGKLKRMLWRHAYPTGRLLRMLRRVGVMRNPFRLATEGELLEIADFFLRGRTKSNVQFLSGIPAEG